MSEQIQIKSPETLQNQFYQFTNSVELSPQGQVLIKKYSEQILQITDLNNLPENLPGDLVKFVEQHRADYLRVLIENKKRKKKNIENQKSLDFRNFLLPELKIDQVQEIQERMAETYKAYIHKCTTRLMLSFKLNPSDVAVVISGGIHMKTSTPKSDIDIDVLKLNPNVEITEFENQLFLELISLGHSIDPYITKELCEDADQVNEQLMKAMGKLYEQGELDDKEKSLRACVAILKDIPRDIGSIFLAIKRNLPSSIGMQKTFLGYYPVVGDTLAIQQFLGDTANYMFKNTDIDIEILNNLIEAITKELNGSPISIIVQEPKYLVSCSLKLLRLEHLKETGKFVDSCENLFAFAKNFGEEFVLALNFFINYRFLMANYKLLDSEFTNTYLIEDEQFLLKIAYACNCNNVDALKQLAHKHLKNLKSGLEKISSKILERKK